MKRHGVDTFSTSISQGQGSDKDGVASSGASADLENMDENLAKKVEALKLLKLEEIGEENESSDS